MNSFNDKAQSNRKIGFDFVQAALNIRIEEMGPSHDNQPGDGGLDILDPDLKTKNKNKTEKPKMYNVIMFNDDYTPMEWVVRALQTYFKHDLEEATSIMLDIHRKGAGVAGTYTYEVAEQKVTEVTDAARKDEHPLMVSSEPA